MAKKEVKPMTKAGMIDTIAAQTGSTKAAVEGIYTALLTVVAKETKKAGVFTLPGLGKFSIAQRKARKGRNPATGAEIKIPAKKTVKFSVSKLIKDAVLAKK